MKSNYKVLQLMTALSYKTKVVLQDQLLLKDFYIADILFSFH